MNRVRVAILSLGVPLFAASCSLTPVEELSSLAEKPPLPYSVLISGGGFVEPRPTPELGSAMGRTYVLGARDAEAFTLDELARTLRLGNVFVAVATDRAMPAPRHSVATVPIRDDAALRETIARARAQGHDFVLVVEQVLDGPVESRGINDRWPFTVVAWVFALGALIPDRTYESLARLRVSMRDVYTGERVGDSISLEPGPVDLNMFERCGIWGFVQSILVPPFWTSTQPGSIVESVRDTSTDRMLLSAVRRLKSVQVREELDGSGPAKIEIRTAGDAVMVDVVAQEMLSGVELILDGKPVLRRVVEPFETALLKSEHTSRSQPGFLYSEALPIAGPGRLQILVETKAARIRSVTHVLEER